MSFSSPPVPETGLSPSAAKALGAHPRARVGRGAPTVRRLGVVHAGNVETVSHKTTPTDGHWPAIDLEHRKPPSRPLPPPCLLDFLFVFLREREKSKLQFAATVNYSCSRGACVRREHGVRAVACRPHGGGVPVLSRRARARARRVRLRIRSRSLPVATGDGERVRGTSSCRGGVSRRLAADV